MLESPRKELPIAATDIARNGSAPETKPAGAMTEKSQRVQKFRNTSPLSDIAREGGEFSEIGTTGLRQFGGFVLEEWLQGLQGRRAAWAYREMQDNDPVIGAILFAIEQLARGVSWQVKEGDSERAEFIEENMHDMEQTWLDFVSEALSMLPYGWSLHEEVFKRRQGEAVLPPDFYTDFLTAPQGTRPMVSNGGWQGLTSVETMEASAWTPASSEFTDGKIGWRKLPVRAQETLLRWVFDGYATPIAMEQIDHHGGSHVVPLEKALLFRTKTTRNNPEGRSILRNAWTSFFRLANIQQIEAIGIERELAGLPQLSPPEGTDLDAPGNEEVRKRAMELVQAVRKDEDEGILFPTAGWLFELTTTGGARTIDTSEVIRRYEQRIASSVLADFVLIGQDSVGSFAMVDVKSQLFGTAIDTILDVICSVMNKKAVPKLLRLNGMKTEDPPKITHSSAKRIDLEQVGRFFQSLALSGAAIPWSKELMEELFKEAGLPSNFEGETLSTEFNATGDVSPLPSGEPGKERRNGQRATGPRNDATERKNPATKPEPAKKADDDLSPSEVLGVRAGLLSAQLQNEVQGALAQIGNEAGTAYLTIAEKADKPSRRQINRLVRRTLEKMNVDGWVDDRLGPILRNHAARTAMDTQRTLQQQTHLEMRLDDVVVNALMQAGGKQLKLSDVKPQVRKALALAIEQGLEQGDNPTVVARRIRDAVPDGRFVHAGGIYRSELIARNETANLQRQAALALYKSNDRIKAVRLRDGIYGPPRSDQPCIERDGTEVPIAEVAKVQPYHPLCTLGFDPVIA